MWMQQSMEGGGHHQGGGYGNYGVGGGSNRGGSSNDEDWKSRIVSNGQWLGEKVMQLATRSHNTIPDNQRTMNDGRANWMAEIRSNARPGGNPSSYSGGSYNAGGYQNDFATERPGQYSDTYRPTSTYSDNPSSYSANTSSGPASSYKKSSKPSKSSSNNKKHKSKSSRRAASSSKSDDDDDDESEELSEDSDVKKKSTKVRAKVVKKPEVIASSADDDSEVDTKPKKSTKAGKKGASAKKQAAVSSESDASTESAPEDKKQTKKSTAKASKKAYSYALDASKLAAVAAPSEAVTKKAGKKKAGKKADKAAAPLEVVDLLGVESLTISSAPSATAAVFEAPKPLSTIDQLAGLSFDPLDAPHAPVQQQPPQDLFGAPHQPFQSQPQQFQPQTQQFLQPPQQFQQQPQQFHQQPPQQFQQQQYQQQQQHPAGFVVPGSNLVDLRLSSEVSAAAKANTAPADTRSLDQLKASSGSVHPAQPMPRMMVHAAHQPVHQPSLMGFPQQTMMPQPMLQHPHAMHGMAPPPMAYGVQYPTQPQPHPSRRDGVASPGFL